MALWQNVRALGLDIDGTLTDGYLYWGGDAVGWTQRYSVRDGEAIVRARAAGLRVIPISRNKTRCAQVRMQSLQLSTQWVGVTDKVLALEEVCAQERLTPQQFCYVGDGAEDVDVLGRVAVGCCPADGHAAARQVAAYVTQAPGGRGAVEEVIEHILAAWAPCS